MLGGLLIVSLLAAGPDVKLAAPGFAKLALSQEQANFFTNHLVTRLSERDWLRVVSSDDISTVIGLERQKELLGCNESKTNCIAELAGALGVDGLITGQVAKVGKSYQVNVKVLDPSAKPLFVYSSERLPSEEAMLDELNKVAELIVKKLEPLRAKRVAQAAAVAKAEAEAKAKAAGGPGGTETKVEPPPEIPPPPAEVTATARPFRWQPWAVTGAGVVVAGLSTIAWVNVSQNYTALHDAAQNPNDPTTLSQAKDFRDHGQNWQLAGIAMAAAGGLAVVGGLLWYFLGSEQEVALTGFIDRDGAWAGLRVPLP